MIGAGSCDDRPFSCKAGVAVFELPFYILIFDKNSPCGQSVVPSAEGGCFEPFVFLFIFSVMFEYLV